MNFKSDSPITFDLLQQLISGIYDAALDESQWANVLNRLAHTLQADSGSMRMLNGNSKNIQQAHTFNVDLQFTQAYIDHYVHIDPWIDMLLKPKKTTLNCTHHLITDKEYESMEIYRDFVQPQEHHYGIGGKININHHSTCYMTFQRAKKRQGFEQHYLDMLYALVPHIQKAVLINEKTRNLELERNSFSDSLNQINSPLILVNKDGKILFINSQAEQFIAQQTSIKIKNNSLFIPSPIEHKKLEQLIHQATASLNTLQQGGAMCFTDSVTQSPISILASPVNPDMVNIDAKNNGNVLLVLNTRQSQQSPSVELLTVLYNLTPAEARLAVELCQGLTLDEISGKLGLSRNTLKSQLRTSFTKTGVSRQAELIRLISSGPAGIIKAT